MATIKEVAKLAGLSRTTVSRVMNNHPYVSDEKREQVLDAMTQLGYVPNSSARRLRKNRTETIAVLISRVVNPFFSKLVDEMERIAAEHGYQVILCNTRQDKDKERNYLELLRTKQVDGVILASIENEWDVIEPYTEYGPIICCNEYREGIAVPSIRLDQIKAGALATNHLIELGHSRVVYIGGSQDSPLSEDRRRGYEQALTSAGINIVKDYIIHDVYGIEDGQLICERLLDLKPRPTAVFAGSDEVAVGLMNALLERGLRIPEDFAVVGFDNQPIAEIISPKLTTIEQPINQLSHMAMTRMLHALQTTQKLSPSIEFLSHQLIIRQSTTGKKN
ncbi:LacI family DNA-binding transcriptional regulator [Bacillus sp. FJAT-45037]|uniref:LacI family DNA-binding transcriptional regulator n=1 Tax=Bacillus sp. FJAT-45037 TaxID=2011007 RepID=UPI000C23C69F|nr:LacI family DNA-binding transcriptional regulator [Bacillus sp. FJAT-45037]